MLPASLTKGCQTALKAPQPPMIGEATHHSIELSWENEEYEARQGPPEGWTSFSIEKMDPKSRTYGTVYVGYSSCYTVKDLEPRTQYLFRLRINKPTGESLCSQPVSACTTREPLSGMHLHKAVNMNDEEQVNRVLESGTVCVNATDKLGLTALMLAAQKGYTRIVQTLVKHGADVNMKNSTGRDSLMLACFSGHLDIVKHLRQYGAKWQSRDMGGCSPLHWAADGGHLPVIAYMIQDGCELDVRDSVSHWTPLMRVSAVSGNAAVASLLIKAGADVNAKDKDGKTPLMVAVLNNYEKLVQLLLDSGADPHVKNEFGAGAAEMANAFGRESIVRLLETKKSMAH
ncbi:fibronectin type 3 and ankyrin repeat domains 1 protein-like [Myripristis murdjan]|uniref:fibronectin type 3 and ankyrin repeat domains 1 protein-like n=1 Tax=Myripristis murdjan TaxID=586833 RepID=UPI001176307B|nr:fibronectin type 3 and ankyrin repeat domains 1 protein-like [Myripristis murdjan]